MQTLKFSAVALALAGLVLVGCEQGGPGQTGSPGGGGSSTSAPSGGGAGGAPSGGGAAPAQSPQ